MNFGSICMIMARVITNRREILDGNNGFWACEKETEGDENLF